MKGLVSRIWDNLKDKPSTATALTSLAAWALNKYAYQAMDQGTISAALLFINAAANAVFFTAKK